jgi:glyoxylate/hydroxypyruvate reductase
MTSPAPGIPGWSFVHRKKTAGFLGFGRIAQATLHRLIGFGITDCIYVSNPASTANEHKYQERDAGILKMYPTLNSIRAVSLQELAAESDMLFILAPGGPETYHLVNEEFLKRMKKTSILVNTARGTLVDSDALAKSLEEGWIWGAGLDCVEGEPAITEDHLLLKQPRQGSLLSLNVPLTDFSIFSIRCVILPHIGSATTESRLAMATLTAQNVIAGMGLSLGGEHRAGVMLEELDLSRFA